jgi:hypothetical protein
MLEFKEAKDQ